MSLRLFEYQGHWLSKHPTSDNLYITWYTPGSRRISRTSSGTDDLEQAKVRLIQHANRINRPLNRDHDDILLLDVLNEYVEIVLKGKASQPKARGILAHYLEFFEIANITWVSEWTWDIQQRYIAWRRECIRLQGFEGKNETLRRELGVLRAALNTYWKRGYMSTQKPIEGLPGSPARERFLTQEEFQQLLAECRRPHLRLFVLLAVHTMQRPGAIFDLRVEQVDLDRGRIDFLPPGETQSNKRKPIVPISNTLRPFLERALQDSVSGFIVEQDGRPLRGVRHSFRRACERAGLGTDVTPYTLRHTGATLAAAAGVPLRQIAGMLGHSDTTMTERYAKHAPEYLQDVVKAVDRVFSTQTSLPRPSRERTSLTAQINARSLLTRLVPVQHLYLVASNDS